MWVFPSCGELVPPAASLPCLVLFSSDSAHRVRAQRVRLGMAVTWHVCVTTSLMPISVGRPVRGRAGAGALTPPPPPYSFPPFVADSGSLPRLPSVPPVGVLGNGLVAQRGLPG